MNLKEYVKTKLAQPGNSASLRLEEGEWCNLLIDPLTGIKDAKYGNQFAIAAQRHDTAEDGSPLWTPCTVYLSPAEGAELVKLLPDDDGRVIVTATREVWPVLDRDGEQKLSKNGAPLFNRKLVFSLYATEDKFEQVDGGVPERVKTAPKTEQSRARVERPLPKPLV